MRYLRKNQNYLSVHRCLQITLLLAGLLLITKTPIATGHNGGEPRLVDVEAGDFRLSMWTLPVPLETGEVNFIAFVAESSSGDDTFVRSNTPVLDATIELVVEPISGGGEVLTITPDHDRATNKLFYESYFELLEPGEYTAILLVEKDGRTGEAGFSFEVAQGALEINWFRYSGLALMAVAIGWFVWQLRQERQLQEAGL